MPDLPSSTPSTYTAPVGTGVPPSAVPTFSSFPTLDVDPLHKKRTQTERSSYSEKRQHSRDGDRGVQHDKSRGGGGWGENTPKSGRSSGREQERSKRSREHHSHHSRQGQLGLLGKKREHPSHGSTVSLGEPSNSTNLLLRHSHETEANILAGVAFADTTGDREAVRYGDTSSRVAPRYRRNEDKVLGLNSGLGIVYARERSEKGLELAPRGRPYTPRYSGRTMDGSDVNARRRLVGTSASSSSVFNAQSDFIQFRRADDDDSGPSNIPEYRALVAREEDEDTADIDMLLQGLPTIEDSVRRDISGMERHLQDHPDDIDAWIRYSTRHLKLRGATFQQTDRTEAHAGPSASRADHEVTLSILATALDAHPTNLSSIRLHVRYLQVAEEVWPRARVRERWKNVIRELGEQGARKGPEDLSESMIILWLHYVEWVEGGGGVDDVVDVLIECLTGMRNVQGRSQEENAVYIILRACLVLKQAGYDERATAIFQANMEFNFFKPDHLRRRPDAPSTWLDAVLCDFESFWESEVPRIGEPGAMGWSQSSGSSPIDDDTVLLDDADSDPFTSWAQAERVASRKCLPGRTMQIGEDDEDPFRVVLFADVKPFLLPIQDPEARLQLVYAFLSFLGLPITPPDVPTSSAVVSDPHLRWPLAYNAALRQRFWPPRPSRRRVPWQTVAGEPMDAEEERLLANAFVSPVKAWSSSPSTMFAPPTQWFCDVTMDDLRHVDLVFARNALTLLRAATLDRHLTVAAFAIENALSRKGATQLAKTVLSANRDDVALWNGYAGIERQRGNIAAARKVYHTALAGIAADNQRDAADAISVLDLWANWAEMEFFEGSQEQCSAVLARAAGVEFSMLESPLPSITVLKIKKFYASFDPGDDAQHLALPVLFLYLEDDIQSACQRIGEFLDTVSCAPSQMELAYQLKARLLHRHAALYPGPASLLREPLEKAIEAFPNNTAFLSLYLWGELGARVHGRVQRLTARLTADADGGIVGMLWSIWAEAMLSARSFHTPGGGGAQRVRMVLDKAVNSTTGKRCIAVWMLYIDFEIIVENMVAAKQLCYRAVSAFGGSKELYLMPFESRLRPFFTNRELRDWGELMVERGVRIRVPFENYWGPEEPEDGEGISLPEDKEPVEDELSFLRERQALKPY